MIFWKIYFYFSPNFKFTHFTHFDRDAVVWDYKKNEYALRTFTRLQDEDMRAFLVHLGRAFITQVSLMVGPNYNLRCQSITNIRADALFSRDHDNENALANFVENYDRVSYWTNT